MIKHRFIHNRKNKLKADGTALIQMEVSFNRSRKFISTDICIEPKFWDQKKQRVSVKHLKHEEYNFSLIDLASKVDSIIREYVLKNKVLSIDSLLSRMEHTDTGLLIDFIESEVEKDDVNSEKTKLSHLNMMNRVKEFRPEVRLDEVDYKFVVDFDNYLSRQDYAINTIAKMHKNLKRFLNLAIKYSLISSESYPYRHFKVRRESTKRQSLSMAELKSFEELKLEKGTDLDYVKDMFLFSVYTGLRISDITRLKNEHFKLVEEGWKLEMKTLKSKKYAYFPLWKLFPLKTEESGKPEFIVWKYFDKKADLFFPKLSEPRINFLLKVLAKEAKIDKQVTFHIARHTFGTIMARIVPLPALQALMGHSDIKTTMIYVHMTNQLLDDTLDNVDWDI
jgi:integrase